MFIQCKQIRLHEGFHAGLESLTCLHHMVCFDIGHYSNNGGFQGISYNVGQHHLRCNSQGDLGLVS